jgi:MFS family permease
MAAPDSVRWMIFCGIVLHGICYDFFFVIGQIYTDKKAPPAIRGQAQGFLIVLTQGVGMYLGAKLNTALFDAKVGTAQGADALSRWPSFWSLMVYMSLGILVYFLLFFRDRIKPTVDEVIEEAASTPETIQ